MTAQIAAARSVLPVCVHPFLQHILCTLFCNKIKQINLNKRLGLGPFVLDRFGVQLAGAHQRPVQRVALGLEVGIVSRMNPAITPSKLQLEDHVH